MKLTIQILLVMVVATLALPSLSAPAAPPPPVTFQTWYKLTGVAHNYSGVPDGILPDILPNGAVSPNAGRENSYVFSMEVFNGYLYVGTMRDIVGIVFLFQTTPPNPWPTDVPLPTDLRARIFRMKLPSGPWELVYVAAPVSTNPVIQGPELGYRKMKTYKAPYADPVLYAGGAGFGGVSRLLAIDRFGNPPVPVFLAPHSESIRALAEHDCHLFWATDYEDYPEIWYSENPLKDYNDGKPFTKIAVPPTWFPKGGEILDMVSYNGFLYVFFFDHDYDNGGFWCAKLRKESGVWKWRLIVGGDMDPQCVPLYPKGMGRMENGGATPYLFNGKMYVGTLSNAMWKFLHTGKFDLSNIPATGTQIFRFGTDDKWERIMPYGFINRTAIIEALNGFANPLNLYLWRFCEFNGRLYAGTFDARIALELFGLDLSGLGLWNPSGFDLYSTTDGVFWTPESLNGFCDPFNYGVRNMVTDPQTGNLYLGTANPFYGCQVWMKPANKLHFGI